MNILVTGGAGFLGLHIAKFLTKKVGKIIILDISDPDKREYPKKCLFVKGDVRDKKLMLKLTKDTDVVIHAAAALPLWKNNEIYDININGSKNILDASLKNKVKRFIYISSTAVYGVPKRHPIFESDERVGVGAYGESKIAAENLCREFRNKGLIVTVIRPKTFVGTFRLGVFEILFDWVKDGKRIPVIGNGTNKYQLLDVDDLVEAIYLFSINKNIKKINDDFNIGSNKYKTVNKDLQELFDYAKSGSRILSTPAFLVKKALFLFEKLKLSPLYQWVYDTADKDSFVSIEKLIKTLNWKPKYSNSQALIKAYQWYLNNFDEIKSHPAGLTHRVGWKQGILGFFKKFL